MKKLLSVLLLSLAFAVPAFAQGHDGDMKEHHGPQGCGPHECGMEHGGGHGMHHDMLGMCLMQADKLGLNQDQVARIKAIHAAMEKRDIRYEADKKLAKLDMHDIMEVKDFDLQKASAAAQKISDLERDHHLAMLKSMKEVRSIFTDEQFKKMQGMKQHMMGGRGCELCGMEGRGEHHHE